MVGQCQCSPTCTVAPEKDGLFCAKHRAKCTRRSPLSGYEPPFEPARWNEKREIRETHNCFSYAMNVHDPKQIRACRSSENCNVPFHQPGIPSKHPTFRTRKLKTCPDMLARMLGDNPSLKMSTFGQKCPGHTSKIALVVDPDQDYHYFRQDTNGLWSHKPGGTAVTNLDADGKLIYDPQLASRNYQKNGSRLDYDTFCAYLCVPRDKPLHLKSGGKRKRFQMTRRRPRSV